MNNMLEIDGKYLEFRSVDLAKIMENYEHDKLYSLTVFGKNPNDKIDTVEVAKYILSLLKKYNLPYELKEKHEYYI